MRNYINTKGMSKEEWHKVRKTFIGASEVGAVLGFNDYSSPHNVYLGKTKEDELAFDEGSLAAQRGKILEPIIAGMVAEKENLKLIKDNKIRFHKDYDFMGCEIDRFELRRPEEKKKKIHEIKSVSDYARRNWTHNPHLNYYCQVEQQMSILEIDFACFDILILKNTTDTVLLKYLPAKLIKHLLEEQIIKNEIESIPIERDDSFIGDMHKGLIILWQEHVLKNIPPAWDRIDIPKIQCAGGTIEVNEELYQKYQRAKELTREIKPIKKELDTVKEDLMLGMAENAILTKDTEVLATWKQNDSKKLNTKKLKTENPEVYERYLELKTNRRFLIKGIEEEGEDE